MQKVVKFQSPFERLKNYDLPAEVILYKAMIIQAITDASIIGSNRKERKLALDAKDWIFGEYSNFYITCHNARIESSFVRKIARKVINLNYNKYIK